MDTAGVAEVKSTKVVDVELCDLCGQECHLYKCRSCRKEICDRCADMIHISVERYSPGMVGAMRSTKIQNVHNQSNGIYCVPCSLDVLKILRQSGIIEDEK